jgi:hypothetical protein
MIRFRWPIRNDGKTIKCHKNVIIQLSTKFNSPKSRLFSLVGLFNLIESTKMAAKENILSFSLLVCPMFAMKNLLFTRVLK